MNAAVNRPAPSSSRPATKAREARKAARAELRPRRASARESILSLDRALLADPAQVARYCRSIFEYTAQLEKSFVLTAPLAKQPEVTRLVRAYLVDSFVRWAFFFRYRQETVFLAVYVLDRYLSLCRVGRAALQTLCATVLFVAAKFEEVKLIQLRPFLKSVAERVEPPAVFALERAVLTALDFRLTTVSPFDFLKRVFHITAAAEERYPLSCFLLESFLYDEECSCFPASEKAAAAFLLTAKLCRIPFDRERLRRYVPFDDERVARVHRRMLLTLSYLDANNFQALKVKYRDLDFVQNRIKAEYLKVKDI